MLSRTRGRIAATALAAVVATAGFGGPTVQAEPGYSAGMVHQVGGKNWKKGNWNGKNWNNNRNWNNCRNCGRYYAPNWVGPAIGFGTGFFVGSIFAQPRYYAPAPRYYAPAYGDQDAYCHRKYRSYNSRTRTYTGYDGKQHYCRIP